MIQPLIASSSSSSSSLCPPSQNPSQNLSLMASISEPESIADLRCYIIRGRYRLPDQQESNQGDQQNMLPLMEPGSEGEATLVVENPFTGSVYTASVNMDRLSLRKEGRPPASKAEIESITVATVSEEGVECTICLDEFVVGGEAKVMPCKHRFHGSCIDKWLKLHGSCPVCRSQFPAKEEGDGDEKRGNGREEGPDELDLVLRRLALRIGFGSRLGLGLG
ncbi:hypothetical protein Dimus_022161 [Dionaea muscipula]